jgi:hypothetical protein
MLREVGVCNGILGFTPPCVMALLISFAPPLSVTLGQALKSSNGKIDQVVEDQSFARYRSHAKVCRHIFL